MEKEEKNKDPLLKEVALLRKRISELEAAENASKKADDDLEAHVQRLTEQLKAADEKLQQEIAVRKRIEGMLREERAQTFSIFDSINEIIYIVDPETHRILYANQTLKNAFKKPLVGGICYEELQDLPSPCGFCTTDILFKNRDKPYQWEYHNPVIKRDFFIIDRLIKWHDGRDVRFEIAIDITERKQAESALLESEKQYRLLVNNIPSVVYKGRMDWSVEFFDDKVEILTGYRAEEFNSRKIKWLDIIVKEDIESTKKNIFQALKTGRSFVRQYRIRNKAGDILWIEDRGYIVCDDKGNVEYLSGLFFDITERKQAEKEREKLEAQFRQAQKMEAIGTLTGGIAHDFNNLLTAIIGNAQLALMDMDKDDRFYEYLEEIKNAGDSAASLTRQLLTFSRKQVIQPKDMDFNIEIRSMERMIRRMIGEDIELLTNLSPDLWKVCADSGQMNQVIMNLLVNARDAMPMGGKITIETANIDLDNVYFDEHGVETEPGPYVMISITDTGIGMDAETRQRIFEPFFTTKEIGHGTGLGLSTVYGIVKQSNGYIWVYSEPGQGTTFKIYFPGAQGDARSPEKKRTPIENLHGSETVLIVEDDDTLRKLAKKVLKEYGYRVLAARDGKDALKVAGTHQGPIHLVLTDVVMPGISGKEVAEQLRFLQPELKVIYMSGYFDDAVTRRGILKGEVNFIVKPFSVEGLARKVREVLEQ